MRRAALLLLLLPVTTEAQQLGIRGDDDVRALFAAYQSLDPFALPRYVAPALEWEEPTHGTLRRGAAALAASWNELRPRYRNAVIAIDRITWPGPSIVTIRGSALADLVEGGSLREPFLATLQLDAMNRVRSWTEHWPGSGPRIALPAGFIADHVEMTNGFDAVLSRFAPRWTFTDKSWQVRAETVAELRAFARRSEPAELRGLHVTRVTHLGAGVHQIEGVMQFRSGPDRGFTVVVVLDADGRVVHRTDHFDLTALRFPGNR